MSLVLKDSDRCEPSSGSNKDETKYYILCSVYPGVKYFIEACQLVFQPLRAVLRVRIFLLEYLVTF